MGKTTKTVFLAVLFVIIVTSLATRLAKVDLMGTTSRIQQTVAPRSLLSSEQNEQDALLAHPRLFFQEAELLQLKAVTTHKEIWEPIRTFAYENLLVEPPVDSRSEWSQTEFRNYGNQLSVFALACVIEENDELCRLAKKTLLTYVEWDHWGSKERRDLGQAHMMIGVALAYDWLYAKLDPAEQEKVRIALSAWTEKMYEASQGPKVNDWGNWWRKSYAQNHHWTNNSALGIAGLALWGEDDRAEEWVEVAATELGKFQLLLNGIEDGSWHEGIHYQNYGLTMALPFLVNLRNLRGIDLLPDAYLKNYVEWRLYNYAPGSWEPLFSFGNYDYDWGNGYHPTNILRWVAAEYQNGTAEWLAQQLAEDGGRAPTVWSAPWQLFEFFYYEPSIVATAPVNKPESKQFQDLGAMVWRTGWRNSDIQFAIKSGAYGGRHIYESFINGEPPWEPPCTETRCELNFGHDHNDALNFTIRRGHEWLMPEVEGNGKQDTAYHNTLLIDGQGQYRPPDNKYRHTEEIVDTDGFVTDVADLPELKYFAADATRRYKQFGDIKDVSRQVVFIEADYFLMLDHLAAKNAHHFTWIGHFAGEIKYNNDWVWSTSQSGQRIGVNSVVSRDLQISTANDGRPFMQNETVDKQTDVRFLHLIYPTDVKQNKSAPNATLLADTGNSVHVLVEHDSSTEQVDTIIINYTSEPSEIGAVEPPFSFDGQVAVITTEAEQLKKLSMVGGTELTDNQSGVRLLEKSAHRSEIETVFIGSTVVVMAEETERIHLYAPEADKLIVNGSEHSFTRDEEYILFEIVLN